MPEIDTSPAALRELADWFNDDLAADVDPQDPPAVEAVLCEVEDRFARIVGVLRAIAAEKESAAINPAALFTRDQFEPDEDEAGVHFDRFANSLADWVAMQPGTVSVAAAARAWNTTPEVIREAADEAAWMFVDGDDNLELEGE